MKNASEILINKIKTVLESDLTPYRIAKELGFANATTIHRYKDGKAKITNMSLSVAAGFEKLYEEMMEMENIKEVVAKVEAWEIGLVDDDPNYHEIEYTDGATDHYIVHNVEGEEIEVFFAEQDHVKELRDEVYKGDKTEEDLIEHVSNLNDLEDQYDYNKVEAYRIDGGQIEWI